CRAAFVLMMLPRPPSTTLFPYTTLFRSEAMTADVRASMALTAERLGTKAVPAGPRRRIDPGVIGSLAAVWPLQLLGADDEAMQRSEEHTSELQSRENLVCRLLLEKKKTT